MHESQPCHWLIRWGIFRRINLYWLFGFYWKNNLALSLMRIMRFYLFTFLLLVAASLYSNWTIYTQQQQFCALYLFSTELKPREREREWIHVYASIKIPQFKSVRNTSMRNSWAIGFKIFDMYRKFSLLKMILSHFFHIFHFHCIYINNVKINEILRLLCNLI